MAKEYKTIMLRDIPEDIVGILNTIGEPQNLKNGTDIIQFIIRDYQKKIQVAKRFEELFYETRKTLEDANWTIQNLNHKVSDIKRIVEQKF